MRGTMDRAGLVARHRVALLEHAIDAKNLSYSPYRYVLSLSQCVSRRRGTPAGRRHNRARGERGECLVWCAPCLTTGACICAERSAICKKMTEASLRAKLIVAVAVASDNEAPCTPCGICRQVVREFCAPPTPIFMPTAQWTAETDCSEHVLVCTLEQLLPHSFGPDMLQPDGPQA